ncbi:hypothetical protein L2E82_09797 [Cichorium intybus]|uniref:Uncharacterized protein n=1 Tax=Cichorium intybus TaxID=13427 RepID=A0ACB9G972_CICIN|nr:hypothetical protein L2E82_09797 [Cichorium intybus]
MLKNEEDYAEFVDKRHENGRIHVYVDHVYEKLNDWIDEEASQEVHEVDVEADYDAISSDSREDNVPENTCTDPFLTELCTSTIQSQVEEEGESQSEDDKPRCTLKGNTCVTVESED